MHMDDRRRIDYLLDELLRLYDEVATLKAKVRGQEDEIKLLWQLAEGGNDGTEGKR